MKKEVKTEDRERLLPICLLVRIDFHALAALTCSVAGMKAQSAFSKFSLNGCASLPGYAVLKTTLDSAVSTETSGLNNQMWAYRRLRFLYPREFPIGLTMS